MAMRHRTHPEGHLRLPALAESLHRMAPRKSTREALTRLLHAEPIGLGNAMCESERKNQFQLGLSHAADWSPALVDRWRQICSLSPRAFFEARPHPCPWGQWYHPTCACVRWRQAARKLLWFGGGLALETFEAPDFDARALMLALYPSTAPESVTATFVRSTSGPWASGALALWAFGPWREGAIARQRLSRIPRGQWSQMTARILVSATWSLKEPGAIGPLLRRLPLVYQVRVVERTYPKIEWAAFGMNVLGSLGVRHPDWWRVDEFAEVVRTVLEISASRDGLSVTRRQRVSDAAGRAILEFGPRAVPLILEFIRTCPYAWLPEGMVATLLQHPDARVREAALAELAPRNPTPA